MKYRRVVFRAHAIQRMFERKITELEVREALMAGETIESYPDDKPLPSRLVLGTAQKRVSCMLLRRTTKRQVKLSLFPSTNRAQRKKVSKGERHDMRNL